MTSETRQNYNFLIPSNPLPFLHHLYCEKWRSSKKIECWNSAGVLWIFKSCSLRKSVFNFGCWFVQEGLQLWNKKCPCSWKCPRFWAVRYDSYIPTSHAGFESHLNFDNTWVQFVHNTMPGVKVLTSEGCSYGNLAIHCGHPIFKCGNWLLEWGELVLTIFYLSVLIIVIAVSQSGAIEVNPHNYNSIED